MSEVVADEVLRANALLLDASDNVAVALEPIEPGAHAVISDGQRVTLTERVPRWHKFAVRPIEANERIIKHGAPIGVAIDPLAAGVHVHVHNVRGLGFSGVVQGSANDGHSSMKSNR